MRSGEAPASVLLVRARTDYAMWLGALFLLLAGSGPWSLDAWLSARRMKHGA